MCNQRLQLQYNVYVGVVTFTVFQDPFFLFSVSFGNRTKTEKKSAYLSI